MVLKHEIGYEPASKKPNEYTFRPTFHSFLFGGAIRIVIDGRVARLDGPKVSLEIFRRLYRLQHHVQRVQYGAHARHRRTGERYREVIDR